MDLLFYNLSHIVLGQHQSNFATLGSKAMDVLLKFEKSPVSLERLANERVASMVLHAIIFRGQIRNADHNLRIAFGAEESVKMWAKALAVKVREEVLAVALRQLSGGMKFQPLVTNLPIIIASVIEILYCPQFEHLQLPTQLQWHRESRTKILHLLHQYPSSLKQLHFQCYDVPLFKFEAISFSEKFILTKCFYRFNQLKMLKLPHVCDDELLAYISQNCPHLEELDVRGSFGVTNQGVRWMSGFESPPESPVSFASHDPEFKRNSRLNPVNPSRRVGFRSTPFQEAKRAKRIELRTLKLINFEGTSIDQNGLEILLHSFPCLKAIHANDDIWNKLFEEFDEENGHMCMDCVNATENGIEQINMTSGVGKHIATIAYIFPRIRHLILDAIQHNYNIEFLAESLSSFLNLKSLTLKNVDIAVILPALREHTTGDCIRTICLDGENTIVDLSLLSSSCPNLKALSVTKATITRTNNQDHEVQSVKALKLWEIKCSSPEVWKSWIKSLPALERLFLWNLVINDSDLAEIMLENPLRHLKDIRIASSEIGYIRLTEETTRHLIQNCPGLKRIGGICDWHTRDLLSLLHELMVSGGWRICLDHEEVNEMFRD